MCATIIRGWMTGGALDPYPHAALPLHLGALCIKRPLELASAWQTAWGTGPRWREKLEAGREHLPEAARLALRDVMDERV